MKWYKKPQSKLMAKYWKIYDDVLILAAVAMFAISFTASEDVAVGLFFGAGVFTLLMGAAFRKLDGTLDRMGILEEFYREHYGENKKKG